MEVSQAHRGSPWCGLLPWHHISSWQGQDMVSFRSTVPTQAGRCREDLLQWENMSDSGNKLVTQKFPTACSPDETNSSEKPLVLENASASSSERAGILSKIGRHRSHSLVAASLGHELTLQWPGTLHISRGVHMLFQLCAFSKTYCPQSPPHYPGCVTLVFWIK